MTRYTYPIRELMSRDSLIRLARFYDSLNGVKVRKPR